MSSKSSIASRMRTFRSTGSCTNCRRVTASPRGVETNCSELAGAFHDWPGSVAVASSTTGTTPKQPPSAPTPNASSHSHANAMGGGRPGTGGAAAAATPPPDKALAPGVDAVPPSGAQRSAPRRARVATPVLNVVDSGRPKSGSELVVVLRTGKTIGPESNFGCGSTSLPAESLNTIDGSWPTTTEYTQSDWPSIVEACWPSLADMGADAVTRLMCAEP